MSFKSVRDGVGGVDPAVGVHDVQRNFVHDAVNGVTDVLSGGDQERKGDQDDDRRLVM